MFFLNIWYFYYLGNFDKLPFYDINCYKICLDIFCIFIEIDYIIKINK